MGSAKSIWEGALTLIRPKITDISLSQWFLPIEPVTVKDDMLVLQVKSELHKNTILSQYMGTLADCVNLCAGRPLTIRLIEESERDRYESTGETAASSSSRAGFIHNPKYTFETFVIGESNRFAYAASQAVANSPATAYNPLFLYGGVGLGKTHLMHAIGCTILQNNPRAKVIYTTTENFTNELIKAIQGGNSVQYAAEFREKYRSVDVLMIDDIQFLSKKEDTQNEFFHTFNELKDNGKQIIITSDKHPREIPMLEERLRTRFEWGLVADIQPPDIETKIAILNRKAEQEGIRLSSSVMAFIADKAGSNIRELEGALNKLVAYSTLHQLPIDVNLAERALKDTVSVSTRKIIRAADIMQVVCDFYNVTPADLCSPKRDAAIVMPRQVAIYLVREITNMTLNDISSEFGGRHHTSIMHAINKVKSSMQTDVTLKNIINDLKSRCMQ